MSQPKGQYPVKAQWKSNSWQVRLTAPDGSRPWAVIDGDIPPPPEGQVTADAVATEMMTLLEAEPLRWNMHLPCKSGRVPQQLKESKATATLTVSEFAKLWLEERKQRGVATVDDDEARLRNHVLPLIGPLDMLEVNSDDLRGVVEHLDARVLDETVRFTDATAGFVWATTRQLFKDAQGSKKRHLRMRIDNPALNVAGPDRGPKRNKQWLYPGEFESLISCDDVPIRWLRLYALAIYLYARQGELRALTCEDIDLDRRLIRIHRSVSRKTGEIKRTKAGEIRDDIYIEPNLVPLIDALVTEASGKGQLIAMPPEEDLSCTLRRHLERAKVNRKALRDRTDTSLPITFHDLRATGITWMAMRGDDPLTIRDRAGHAEFSTTEGYIRRGRNRSEFGEPFPALPQRDGMSRAKRL